MKVKRWCKKVLQTIDLLYSATFAGGDGKISSAHPRYLTHNSRPPPCHKKP